MPHLLELNVISSAVGSDMHSPRRRMRTANFSLSPAVGVQWKLCPRLKVHLVVGYEWKELERLKTYADPEFSYGLQEQLNHQSLMIKAGVTF